MSKGRNIQVSGFRFQVSKRGFTMIELLVVMAIIIVITTISIPTIDTMTSPKHALRKEGRKIMLLMTEARTAAMNRKVQVELRIDSETRRIYMVETRAFEAAQSDDSVFESEINTNVFEKAVSFDEAYSLAVFTADQIQAGSAEKQEDPFEEPAAVSGEETTDAAAVYFNHFGGSGGGGITLARDDLRLHIAADILTGRPKLVTLESGE